MTKRSFTATQRHALMSRLLASSSGRARIASTMTEPLRTLRDYSAVARKAFMVDELPDGGLPVYDMDIDLPAYVVNEEANSVETIVKSSRLTVPMYELASLPKIPFSQIKERRFDVVSRIKKKAEDEIFRKEDRILFAMMAKAVTDGSANAIMGTTAANFNMDLIADAFARVERHGLRVDKIYMNPMQFPVVRKAGRDYMDFETQRSLLKTGFLGTLWGAAVYQSAEVPVGDVYLVTEPEYFGVMPIRLDLTCINADLPHERAFAWSVFMNNGAAIHNPKGIQGIRVSG